MTPKLFEDGPVLSSFMSKSAFSLVAASGSKSTTRIKRKHRSYVRSDEDLQLQQGWSSHDCFGHGQHGKYFWLFLS